MEVVEVARAGDGTPVFVDKHALEMDGIILVNRIKPHPSFGGPFESGLIKMTVIGLGKHKGAEACHRLGFGNFADRLLEMFGLILERVNILFGVAIMENAYDQTLDVVLVAGNRIIEDEPKLLAIAKNISGSRADPNVTGRLYDRFDMAKSYINGITSTLTSTCRLPMVMRNDCYALKAAIRTCNAVDLGAARIARIRDTLSLGRIMVSEALLDDVSKNRAVQQESELAALPFDADGNLSDTI